MAGVAQMTWRWGKGQIWQLKLLSTALLLCPQHWESFLPRKAFHGDRIVVAGILCDGNGTPKGVVCRFHVLIRAACLLIENRLIKIADGKIL
jgi:hypothetical protein